MRHRLINGENKRLENWHQVNWRKAIKVVKNLRYRIFRARNLGNWRSLRRLQKLMLRSQSNLLLCIRQITQVNTGKRTAGIDKEVINTPQQRVKLFLEMAHTAHIVKPTKRIYIPKSNGKKRPLGIPTVRDRVMQAVFKNLLEPEWETLFSEHSYGFRPGRCCADAIEQSLVRICASGKSQQGDVWVLDADISSFFDNISHSHIENSIGNIPGRELIKMWLKSGFMDKGTFNETIQGTPQGGTISPLLANIGLHGLEEAVRAIPYRRPRKGKPAGRIISEGMGIIRYADDFIVTAHSKEYILEAKKVIETWLKERNLELSAEKTRIVHTEDGFDFLGFNLRTYKGKALFKPAKSKVLAFCKRIGELVKSLNGAKQEQIIFHLNPILRGFANYYRGGVSKEVFNYVDHRIWQYLWRWAKRRHPRKSTKWIKDKYFHQIGTRKWVFAHKSKDRRNNPIWLKLYGVASTPIVRHIKVKGKASPDNPDLREYWVNRNKRMGKIRWSKGSKYYIIAQDQDWTCPICGEPLLNGENLDIHHIVPVKDGGRDDTHNLIHLHSICHKQEHSKPKKKS
jgi:RNA-directed DNA polymerase